MSEKKSAAAKPAAAATKPVAPTTRVVVRVVAPARGRRRAGRQFGAVPVDIPADDLSAAQIDALTGDPELTVGMVYGGTPAD